MGNEDSHDDPIFTHVGEEHSNSNASVDIPQISLNAMTGNTCFQTMKVIKTHDKKLIHILLDSGNAHNFLDLKIAKKLRCKLEKVAPMTIIVGRGDKLVAPFICKDFIWMFQQKLVKYSCSTDKVVVRKVVVYHDT